MKNNTLTLLDRISNDGGDIETLFVERIAQLLKPQGLAAVILPVSILTNGSGSYVGARETIFKNNFISQFADEQCNETIKCIFFIADIIVTKNFFEFINDW